MSEILQSVLYTFEVASSSLGSHFFELFKVLLSLFKFAFKHAKLLVYILIFPSPVSIRGLV